MDLITVPELVVKIMGPSVRNNGRRFDLYENMLGDFRFTCVDEALHAFMAVPSVILTRGGLAQLLPDRTETRFLRGRRRYRVGGEITVRYNGC